MGAIYELSAAASSPSAVVIYYIYAEGSSASPIFG